MEDMKLGREYDRVQEAELEGRVWGGNDGKDNIEYIIKFYCICLWLEVIKRQLNGIISLTIK